MVDGRRLIIILHTIFFMNHNQYRCILVGEHAQGLLNGAVCTLDTASASNRIEESFQTAHCDFLRRRLWGCSRGSWCSFYWRWLWCCLYYFFLAFTSSQSE